MSKPPPYLDRRPLLVHLDDDQRVTAHQLEAVLTQAGMPVTDLRLKTSSSLPHNIFEWVARHEDGTVLGGWLDFDYLFDGDSVEVTVEIQVLEPEPQGNSGADAVVAFEYDFRKLGIPDNNHNG